MAQGQDLMNSLRLTASVSTATGLLLSAAGTADDRQASAGRTRAMNSCIAKPAPHGAGFVVFEAGALQSN
jgi:hypothetical protein